MKSLSFLIPAYNDEATIATQVQEAAQIGRKLHMPFEIVVTNDASSDNTGVILDALRKRIKQLQVITHRTNKGYGDTIKELYFAARKEWLFTIPGDYQVKAKELLKLTPYEQEADILLGWRRMRHDTKTRQFQSRVYNTLILWLFGTNTHDVNSVRLMRSAIMKSIRIHGSSAFTDAELIIKAKMKGFRVEEIPIGHSSRADGTGAGGKLMVILPTIWEMLLLKIGLL